MTTPTPARSWPRRAAFVYARLTPAEHAQIVARAAAAGLSLSEYVRRALNLLISTEDEDAVLLKELHGR